MFEIIFLMFLILGSFLAFLVFLFVLIDIIRHEFTGYNKLIWIIVILCLPLLGTILYLFWGRKQRIKT